MPGPLRSFALLTSTLALVAPLVTGCHGRETQPFDAAADCPKIAYCGQCASRGACVWCGDSSTGQCMAVGHAECAAPAALSKTPEVCPAPPPGTPAASKAPATSDASDKRAGVEQALRRAFPDAKIDETVLDAVVELLLHRAGDRREQAPITKHVQEKDHRLYMAEADHHRVRSMAPESRPMESEFVMALPMVRVTLPESIAAGSAKIATEIGDVDLLDDHLLGSVDLIAQKYGDDKHLGYRPERVDLLTAARTDVGGRFGGIAVYLGYRHKADRAPSFYMLEAGMAGGDAKMIYFSSGMDPIASVTSYYLPTAFVTMANSYSGGITMRPAPDEDEIAQLVVRSSVPGSKDPYITVTVDFRRSPTMDVALAKEITTDAGARVALIAQTMGLSSAVELQDLLAHLGHDLQWKQVPHYTDVAGAAATPAASTPATPPAPSAPPAPVAPR